MLYSERLGRFYAEPEPPHFPTIASRQQKYVVTAETNGTRWKQIVSATLACTRDEIAGEVIRLSGIDPLHVVAVEAGRPGADFAELMAD